ncbi:PLP-dependent aminotransferase family protein [Isoptericola sp. NPDC019693]|uniref:MocR-like pyridoxine biosynthesis transcription factor PdxR n=1 Tax=Isoptericola sp. NPDC019693 TaxID=3364009 RepID=UPI0037AB1631
MIRLQPEDLLLVLGARPPSDVGAWLRDGLRDAVASGRLEAGAALPSSRSAAAGLGVARGTVAAAVDELVGEGVLESRPRSSVVVADLARHPVGASSRGGPADAPPRPASVGAPDPALFPRAAWARAVRDAVRALPDAELGYPDPQGLLGLREALAAHLRTARAAPVEAEDVVIVSGVAQGLALLGEVLAGGSSGRRVVVEDPASPGVIEQLRDAGLDVVPVPVDGRGLRTDALPDAAAAVVTPAHQFPLGVVLAPDRRRELVAWARDGDRLVLEDDYDAELRYDRQPVGALRGLDPEHVALLGSVSKLLSPALRLGWVVAPPGVREALVDAKRRADLGCSVPEQAAFARMIESGAYARHLRRARLTYRRRRGLLLDALAREVPHLPVEGVAAGLHLVVRLPDGDAEARAVAALRGAGVPADPLSGASARAGAWGVILGAARVQGAAVPRVVEILGAVVTRGEVSFASPRE